jgi:23S rRNA (adenine2503-C2)-methyltransferase
VRQVWEGLYARGRPADLTNLPKALRARLAELLPPALRAGAESVSDDGDTVKWLWELADGARVETVLMHYRDRTTVCVSTQAGCAMACSFCATGQAGFERHLTVGEIVEQVIRAARVGAPRGGCPTSCSWAWASPSPTTTPPGPPSSAPRRRRASRPATSPSRPSAWCPASDAWPPRPARSTWRCRCTPERRARDELVPINRRYPLAELAEACHDYLAAKRPPAVVRVGADRRRQRPRPRRPTARRLRPAAAGPREPHPAQPHPRLRHPRHAARTGRRFRDRLRPSASTPRCASNRGTDIDAACGQLRAGHDPR